MRPRLFVKVMTTAALLSACTFPAYADVNLTDIEGSYAKDAILELVEKGIINGKGNGKFDPTSKISRQDFAIILARALELDTSSTPSRPTFNDVPAEHYSFSYVEAAVQAGLIQGQGSGRFGLGQNLSRQDMAVLFVRSLGVDSAGMGSQLSFTDASQISGYAKDAVGAAVELGLVTGNPNGTFNPLGSADRQSVALVASRFLETKQELENNQNTPPVKEEPKPEPTQPSTPGSGSTPAPSTPSQPSNPNPPAPNPPNPNPPTDPEQPQPDTTSPTLTLVSQPITGIGTSVKVKSSEAGTVYLVPSSLNQPARTSLEEIAGNLKEAAKATISAANTETELPTNRLLPGDYKVYAVDAAGNVSAPSSTIKVESAANAMHLPKLILVDHKTLALEYEYEYDNELDPLYVPTKDLISIQAYNNLNLPIEQITINGSSVRIRLEYSLPLFDLNVSYKNSPQHDQRIRTLEGRESPEFVEYGTVLFQQPDEEQLRSALAGLLEDAEELLAQIEELTVPYPPDITETLGHSIADAKDVLENEQSPKTELQSTYYNLYNATNIFEPITYSLAKNATPFVLNGNPDEVTITAIHAAEDSYHVRNIKNLIQLKQANKAAYVEYNPNLEEFEVKVDYRVVGHVEIESKDGSMEVTKVSNGVTITPAAVVGHGNYDAELRFRIFQYGKEIGSIELPIQFDLTGPTATRATYEYYLGIITVNSEELLYLPDGSANADIQFNPNGEDLPVSLIQGIDFNITNPLTTKRISIDIELTSEGKEKLAMYGQGGKLHIILSGLTDYVGNPIQSVPVEAIVSSRR
ncbi:S-layer homology domain-containing protein [Paenibacillus lemnae]|uniref:S-layer homology domain-containing protein n=1 Tax=Paenibacillus lemnae TaxID=1330551 RepID=A0A848M3F6_PAELE|nr:S-layer homology domain-containing protein [Paenibacillus lemnae]NMO94373.1 S-layer homology domain-containing protein [Paenibacillus lemnae]